MGAFHEGEQVLQERTGVRERLAEVGAQFLRDYMPEQHREFFPLLPFIVAGSVDASGQPWASVLAGPAGFVSSPDARTLSIATRPHPVDPLAANVRVGAAMGLLGIQPHTRRRNRMNGHVTAMDERSFDLSVDQSFGNCPKYIRSREPRFIEGAQQPGTTTTMAALDEAARALVQGADTFFIATAHPRSRDSAAHEHGVDVSHRGGNPGFVRVDDSGRVLLFPDFTGNSYFNTIGNLLLEPRCGLVFIDFESGTTLQVAAGAELVEDGAELASFRGALRLLRMEVTSALRVDHALPLRWTAGEPSPVLERTGTWS